MLAYPSNVSWVGGIDSPPGSVGVRYGITGIAIIVLLTVALSMAGGSSSAKADDLYSPGQSQSDARSLPATAPNILLVMTDDVGFAASTSFGGPIPTPTLDKLANSGMRYNNFHVTAQCAPTRAALLTGRNPHSVGMGEIPETGGRADPGYTTAIPRSAAMIPRVLRDHGYRSAVFGKYHLIPKWELSAVGPFDHWPTSRGFDYFYGIEPAMTDQFTPNIIEDTRIIAPPKDLNYFFERDIADRAIHWLREGRAAAPEQPFFLYIAPVTPHAPVQAPQEWIEKFRGRFDHGWDVEREEILARQKQMGVVPENALLTPRVAEVPAWDSLGVEEQELSARYMEVYAAAVAYVDHQVGRLVAELQASGEYDNTLVIYIQGDNGASPEGGVNGIYNYYNALNELGLSRPNAFTENAANAIEQLDKIGGPESAPAIPIGWATALNTPFSQWKSDASHLGGQRTGMVISWPGGMSEPGSVGRQFHAVTDIAPTIYEVAAVTPPDSVDGVRQQPIDGISMAYTFDAPAAPSRRGRQYFENRGTMAMYSDGWWASYRLQPGQVIAEDSEFKSGWKLYNLKDDFSQSQDLASDHSGKLKEMQSLFREEASRNQVFPIGAGFGERLKAPAMEAAGRYVLYPGTERYSDWGFPNVRRRSWSVSAEIRIPPEGGSGLIVNQGGRFAGWGMFLLDGVPNFVYRSGERDSETLQLRGKQALAAGSHIIEVDFSETSISKEGAVPPGRDRAAVVSLKVDGVVVAEGETERPVGSAFMYQGAAIGHSTGSALTAEYSGRFAFNGGIDHVTFDLAERL